MSSEPFDDLGGRFYVLVDHERRYSLWPSFADVPADRRIVFGQESHDRCLAYVEEHRRDVRKRIARDATGLDTDVADAA